jgi:hypothetical protein
MLVRADTWRGAWLNLRRAHKDRRARKQLIQLAWACLIPFVCLAYAIWIFRVNALVVIPILIPIFIWQAIRGKERREQAEAQRRQSNPHRELDPQQMDAFRAYFADVALIYAVMLDRAGSERYVQEKVLPEGIEITTRRVHLDVLKSTGLWDKMDQRDREAMMAPDGSWSRDWIEHLTMGFEPLRLLRWLLKVDSFLPNIGQQLRFDYKLANEIVRAPEKLRSGKAVVQTSVIEVGRRAAEGFYNRCIAEQIHRGYVEPKDEHSSQVAARIATSMADKQHEDLVLGVKLVSEASRDELIWATMLARRRLGFFHWTLVAMNNGAPPEPPYKFQP